MKCPQCSNPCDYGDLWANSCCKCGGSLAIKEPRKGTQEKSSRLVMAAWVAAYSAGASGADMWRAFVDWSEGE